MTATVRVLETLTRTALLGARLWDRVGGRAVSDGIELVHLASGARAVANRSGVFVLHDVPGMRESAFGAGDEEFWAAAPSVPATFEVRDRDRRFVAFRFDADLPAKGLFTSDVGMHPSAPDHAPAALPLFSAPSRATPAGFAAVRAQLWDADADRAAAGAVLEIAVAGIPAYRGIADAEGRAAVLLPYPEPAPGTGSPPHASRALVDLTWPLTVSARYAPAAAGADPTTPRDLRSTLTQPVATLLAAQPPSASLGAQTLSFGRELVLRSSGRSVLLVQPA
jgi:hypothetical protein